MSTPSCQLCEFEGAIATRNHGLDLCEACSAGYLAGRLDAIGVEMTIDEVERRVGRRGDVVQELHVVARKPDALPIIAVFQRKTLGLTLRNAFERGRFLSGDPLFVGRIWTETRTEGPLRTMLANDGFQSAVMALVGACGLLKLQPGVVDVRANLEDLDLRAEVPVAVGALLRHMASAA